MVPLTIIGVGGNDKNGRGRGGCGSSIISSRRHGVVVLSQMSQVRSRRLGDGRTSFVARTEEGGQRTGLSFVLFFFVKSGCFGMVMTGIGKKR